MSVPETTLSARAAARPQRGAGPGSAIFLSQPVSWVFLIVGGIIAFLSLYPTYFLFYGSLTDAPLGVPGQVSRCRITSAPTAIPKPIRCC